LPSLAALWVEELCEKRRRRPEGDPMAEGGQQQGGGQQQQQPSPLQLLGRALTDIRKVQNMLELQNPGKTQAIQMQRDAGDLLWQVIQQMQQQQGQQGSQ
jgi:hypothetical protein